MIVVDNFPQTSHKATLFKHVVLELELKCTYSLFAGNVLTCVKP